MEVEMLEREGNRLRFIVRGMTLPVANALRRVMISEVPSMAIEDVIIIENSSPIRDEILAHRLGLIPLRTDLESYLVHENCDCRSEFGCNKCSVTLTLEAEAVDSSRVVYSKELKSADPCIIPVSGEIPILKLAHNQKVRFEAYARLGRGKEHAKWQPVSVCVVRSCSKINIDLEKCNVCKNCVDACAERIFRIEGERIEIVNSEECNDCERCKELCSEGALKVERYEDVFVFDIESTGVMPPEEIFDNAIELLRGKAREFIDCLSNLK